MKTYIICFLFAACIAGCTTQDTPTGVSSRSVAVLVDYTDKLTLYPTAPPILSLFGCTDNPQGEAWFHLSEITDKKYNEDYTAHLQPTQATDNANDDNPQYRNMEIVSYYNTIRQGLSEMYSHFDTSKSLANSEIFAAICRQLQWLQGKHSASSFLIVYSNLLEHSNILDAYTVATEKNTAEIIAKCSATNLLPKQLTDATVFFINAPVSRAEDSRYSVILAAFTTLLESRGCKVVVQGNNKNYEP